MNKALLIGAALFLAACQNTVPCPKVKKTLTLDKYTSCLYTLDAKYLCYDTNNTLCAQLLCGHLKEE